MELVLDTLASVAYSDRNHLARDLQSYTNNTSHVYNNMIWLNELIKASLHVAGQ
jgi:uncharacterized protein Smg (DUF494 family)